MANSPGYFVCHAKRRAGPLLIGRMGRKSLYFLSSSRIIRRSGKSNLLPASLVHHARRKFLGKEFSHRPEGGGPFPLLTAASER
jgi:hypothetical protein